MQKSIYQPFLLMLALCISSISVAQDCDNGIRKYRASSYERFNSFSIILFKFECEEYHAFWHFQDDSYLEIYPDGSALLYGSAEYFYDRCLPAHPSEIWNVHVSLLPSEPFEAKVPIGDPDFSLWEYFRIDSTDAYMESTVTGERILLAQKGPGSQMGQGANTKTDTFGFSTWFYYLRESGYRRSGDFAIDLEFEECVVECGECDGKVTDLTLQYNGSVTDASVSVIQKKDKEVVFNNTVQPGDQFSFSGVDKKGTLGTEIIIEINGQEHTRIHTSCSQPIGPGVISGDFEVVDGSSRNGGRLCPEDSDPDPDPTESCCDGKVTNLSMEYNGGEDDVVVTVIQKKDGNIVFHDILDDGDSFSFTGTDKKGTLGTEITLEINGEPHAQIHTSCSQPIGPGLVAGDFTVTGGSSFNGGDLCDVASDAQDTEVSGKSKLSIFPNPAASNGSLSIDLHKIKKGDDYDIQLRDLSGNLVFNTTVTADNKDLLVVQLTTLDPGLYVLYVVDGKKEHQGRVLID